MLAASTMTAAGLAGAPTAHAAPQDIQVSYAVWQPSSIGNGADTVSLLLSENIPLGVHGTVTISACGRVLGTLPFIGNRSTGVREVNGVQVGSVVEAYVNGVEVAEYGYIIRLSDPTMPVLEGTRTLDIMPSGFPSCENAVVNPTATDFNEAPNYNEVPSDYVLNRGKTKVNGKRWMGRPFKVGDSVKVTPPRLSIEAKAYAAKVTYKWTLTPKGHTKGKVVATGSKVKIKRAWKGRYLTSEMFVSDTVFKHPWSTYAGGGTGLIG